MMAWVEWTQTFETVGVPKTVLDLKYWGEGMHPTLSCETILKCRRISSSVL
jgi:hypothetical protein